MPISYQCPSCQSQTTSDIGITPECVSCDVSMVVVGAQLGEGDTPDATDAPLAPINVAAYQDGLKEIEEAKRIADAEEREYIRAKEYASKAKKSLETAELKLRGIITAVSNRLRPRPLFEAPDTHTAEELVALLADAGVLVTAEAVRGWTDAQRADARAYALAAHSEQPRLIPPFLWVGEDADEAPESGDVETPGILEGESAVAYAKRRQEELAAEAAAQPADEPAEPPADEHPGHHYPKRVGRKATRRKKTTEPFEDEASDPDQPEIVS
jgi:hypothetical protein